jgi:trimeric autotransporter adhesin
MRLTCRAVAVVALAGAGLVPAASVSAGMVPHPGGTPKARGAVTAQAAAPVISTLVGGVGGPGPAVSVGIGGGAVSYAAGDLYLAYGVGVRAVNTVTDALTTPAGDIAFGGPYGDDPNGPLGDGSPATQVPLVACGATADAAGNLVIADCGNSRVRVVAASTGTFYGQAMTAGDIYTVAGGGPGGGTDGLGDGGPATQAELNSPSTVAVDSAGNLVIADKGDNRIRLVAASTGSFYGQAMTAGDIYTVAGGGSDGLGDGGPATGAELDSPVTVAVDGAGNLVITDTGHNRVRVVAASTGTFYGQAMTAGDIYTVAGNGTEGFTGDGGSALAAELSKPEGVAVDGSGNLIIADTYTKRVRVVAARTGTFYGQAMTAGDIYPLAGNGGTTYRGDGGAADRAALDYPSGVAVDGAGNVVIFDAEHDRVRVVAVRTGTFYGQAMTAGDIYTVAGNGNQGYSGDGGPQARAELAGPEGLATDAAGDLAITDSYNHVIRLVAASTGQLFGQAMTAGDIYTVAGNGVLGFSGDGGLAGKAELANPTDVAFDRTGNLVIADSGNARVRVVAKHTGTFYGQAMTAGHIYTVAGDGSHNASGDGGPATEAGMWPQGVAVSKAGNLLIADGNGRVRVVAASTGSFYGQAMTAGDVYTVAGGGSGGDGVPAIKAALNDPQGVTTDGAGNLVIADTGDGQVRVVANSTGTFYGQAMTAHHIYTVASGIGPVQTAVDGAGNLIVANGSGNLNNGVLVVAGSTGTFYGQAMTIGHVYTVAGDNGYAFSGDGGPATAAQFYLPAGVAVTGAGNLLISDWGNNRVRQITP